MVLQLFEEQVLSQSLLPTAFNVARGGVQLSAWLAQAIRMAAGGLAFGVGSEVVAPALFDRGAGAVGIAQSVGDIRARVTRIDPRTGLPVKRRRRRRALTASDKADIAFIVGLLGKTAGSHFAVSLGARSR